MLGLALTVNDAACVRWLRMFPSWVRLGMKQGGMRELRELRPENANVQRKTHNLCEWLNGAEEDVTVDRSWQRLSRSATLSLFAAINGSVHPPLLAAPTLCLPLTSVYTCRNPLAPCSSISICISACICIFICICSCSCNCSWDVFVIFMRITCRILCVYPAPPPPPPPLVVIHILH